LQIWRVYPVRSAMMEEGGIFRRSTPIADLCIPK
jgi:hypothetical protein